MKIQISGALCLALEAQFASAQAQAPQPKPNFVRIHSKRPQNVAFLIYPGVEALDLSGPVDVFVKANDLEPGAFNIYTVAATNKTVQSQSGVLTLSARYDLNHAPRPDILIVPGASVEQVRKVGSDARLQRWIRANATKTQTVMSVCTGAFIIGKAGLFDGKNSTTHWFCLDDFQREFPRTKAFEGARFVRDSNIISTEGVSSGIDGALQLIEQTRGKARADFVAKVIQYRRNTPAFPAQKFARVQLRSKPAGIKVEQLALDFDPVCHMKLSAKDDTTFAYKGKTYGFCSPGCRDTFAAHPEQFLKTK